MKTEYDIDLIPEPFGLRNIGNNCYLNSILQALYGCSIFNGYIAKVKSKKLQLFLDLLNNTKSDIHLNILLTLRKQYSNKDNMLFIQQEDAGEVFLIILDYFKLLSFPANIDTIFGLDYKRILLCKNCNTSKIIKNDLTYNINIPIELEGNIIDYMLENVEKLNDYKCDSCSISGNIIKINLLINAPYIIVVMFNKFYKKKNINFPKTFILKKKYKYKLVSDIHHFGSMNMGHYISRSIRYNNKIYLFNDDHYEESDLEPAESTYMLFYHYYI